MIKRRKPQAFTRVRMTAKTAKELTRTPVAIALVLGLSGCSSTYDTRPTYARADHGPTRMCLFAEEFNCLPTGCVDPCNFLTLLVYNHPNDQCGAPRLIPLG
jgi:hypothetical protein